MKRIILFYLISLVLMSSNLQGTGSLRAYLSYSLFVSPDHGPYIETYLAVLGKSITYVRNEDGRFQGRVEVTLIFKQDSIVRDFEKYELVTHELDDTAFINFNLIDQKRFLLANGSYDFEVKLKDMNSDSKEIRNIEIVEIDFPAEKISISGIQLVESYTETVHENILSKTGYDLVPQVVNFYPDIINEIIFYAEIYNTDKVFGPGEKYLVSCYIESFETNKYISNLIRNKKEVSKPVNVVFQKFDISDLPSGNFNLVIEVRDQKNSIITINKLFFQRSNPKGQLHMRDIAALEIENTFAGRINHIDTLKEYINCLIPVSSEVEKIYAANQIERNEIKPMQQYFLNFWLSRNNENPEEAWLKYRAEVIKADKNFGTPIKKGYETDRGRVYLQYGPPNVISENPMEPSAYPYQIWQYYQLDHQRNKKFVFISTDLVTNDYELIHSDAIGEISNYSWKLLVHKRDTPTHDPDMIDIDSHFGSKLNDYFNNPR